MKRKQSAASDNPITRLLGAVPALVADQMRELIQQDLEKAGEWEHYRQTISKPGANIGKTNALALVILKAHLGVTDKFFVGSQREQDEEIRRIATEYHNQTLFPDQATKTAVPA